MNTTDVPLQGAAKPVAKQKLSENDGNKHCRRWIRQLRVMLLMLPKCIGGLRVGDQSTSWRHQNKKQRI